MLYQTRTPRLLLLPLLAAAFSTISVCACSVPVFRYAMEHWRADSYEAIIFHRGALSQAEQRLASDLTRDGKAGKLHANVTLQLIDLDQQPKPDELQFWRQLKTETTPWLVLRYPRAARLPATIWSGPLDQSAVDQVLKSPARQEIARRLGQGQSAVWGLLEIGDRQKDDAAAELLTARLAYLGTVLKLPKLETQDIVNGLVSVGDDGLRLEFSSLRISREDPAERAFIKMLLGVESDLEEIKEPILFPIFGRGRALYAIAGPGINHETIDDAASFVIGRCSCQVKEENPGVDLLLAADWDGTLKSHSKTPQEISASAQAATLAPETVKISGAETSVGISPSPALSNAANLKRLTLLGASIIALLVAAVFLLRQR
jgi:hypothetical protein